MKFASLSVGCILIAIIRGQGNPPKAHTTKAKNNNALNEWVPTPAAVKDFKDTTPIAPSKLPLKYNASPSPIQAKEEEGYNNNMTKEYEYGYTFSKSVRVYEEYHFPYRPKFPAHPSLGMCNLTDFKFDEESKLGKGGFGQVFLATHKSGTVVALKYISGESIKAKPKHVENEETIQRILVHPFIGQLLCTMSSKKHDIYFALEYFPGGNLAKQLGTLHPMSRPILVKYVAQIILALRFMHSNCIVYRDLKAENIMIDDNDNVKLIDFGLSIYDCENKLNNLAGTLEYIAPEVAARKAYGRASDYYSLAVLTFVMQTQRVPYRHRKENKEEFARKLAKGDLKIPKTGDADVDELISILSQLDPYKRWQRVHTDFESFKSLPFFNNFDWSLYEDPLYYAFF